MNETPVIRPFVPADREAVIALLRLNTPAYFAPEEESDLLFYLDAESAHYFVVEIGGALVGSGGFNIAGNGTNGRISWDIIHPAHQGKGIGSLLTHFRMKQLRAMPGITVLSVRTSQLAFRFYEKLGFQLKEVVPDYWAPGFDLYHMELPE